MNKTHKMHKIYRNTNLLTRKLIKPNIKTLHINFPLYGAKKYSGDKILEYTKMM